jgi:hypothetical protein
MRRPSLLPPVLVLAALATTGCKSSHDKPESQHVVPAVDGKLAIVDGGMALVTDAGVLSFGSISSIPEDFPKALPIYPGTKVDMATRTAAAHGKIAWSLSLETGDEQPKVVAFYGSAMTASAGGFTKASDLAMGDTQMTVWQSAQYDVTLMIAKGAENETTISMTVNSK